MQYRPFNTPTSITQGSKFSTIVYGPNQDRIKHSDSNGRVTKYVGGIYEEVTRNGETQKIHYVGNMALFISQGDNTNATYSYEYLHRDHIGSIVALSKGTVDSALDVQWQANGAWGERRFQQWSGPLDNLLTPTSTARGFTDHEHLDSVGLIHMNGRVYDPELGRFMSADPFVQAPYNSQSYNRYSYVFNNPLSFTDPSGFVAMSMISYIYADYAGQRGPESDSRPPEHVRVVGSREEALRRRQQDALTNSNNASWFASQGRDQQWAYYGNVAYNIANIQGMTLFALAAGGYFPTELRNILGLPKSTVDWNAYATSASTAQSEASTPSAHILNNPTSFIGSTKYLIEGRRECVAFAQQAGGAPLTKEWRFGAAPNASTPVGTWIGTPGPDGKYGIRDANGKFLGGHVAVFMGLNPDGALKVIHQYKSMPAVFSDKIEDRPDGTYISRDASEFRILLW